VVPAISCFESYRIVVYFCPLSSSPETSQRSALSIQHRQLRNQSLSNPFCSRTPALSCLICHPSGPSRGLFSTFVKITRFYASIFVCCVLLCSHHIYVHAHIFFISGTVFLHWLSRFFFLSCLVVNSSFPFLSILLIQY